MRYFCFSVALLFIANSFATTWQVGASHTYTKPSQVSTLVQNGDTVLIDAGVYEADVACWSANNLVLRGVGGMAHLKANGASYGSKAIWVIAGKNTHVENIEFSLCTVPDKNGAGIRQEGTNLTVSHCYFHDNQDGILAGDDTTSNILIEYSEFTGNGFGDGLSHNLYINHVRSLIFQYNYTHGAKVGHELKSRAYNNYILYNRIADEATGTASRSIDLPNGGLAIIIGNEIEQGPVSENSNLIGYGLEGLTNPVSHQLYLVNNTLVNNKSNGSFVHLQPNTALYKAYNNIFAGPGTLLNGTATSVDTSHNFYTTVANAGFTDASAYDYSLLSSSPAVAGGTDAGMAGSYSLNPVKEYVHPTGSTDRFTVGAFDIGAHEYRVATDIAANEEPKVRAYPNPTSGVLSIYTPAAMNAASLRLMDINGREVVAKQITSEYTQLYLQGFSAGMYLLCIKGVSEIAVRKIQLN